MKILLYILLLGLSTFVSNAQDYSNKGVDYYVQRLERSVLDTIPSLDENKTVYHMVYDNNTLPGGVVTDPDYSDNKTFSTFLKLYNTGKLSDFIKMTKHSNQSIRFYGFWAVLRKGRFRKAKKIIESEKVFNDSIYWVSIGCEIISKPMVTQMNQLYSRIKEYGY